MSNRTAIIIGASIVVLALLILTNFGRNLPFMDRDGSSTVDENARPERPDKEIVDRFPTQSIEEMITALLPEQPAPPSAPPSFADNLPDAALPFTTGEAPRDAEALKSIIATTQEGAIDDLTLLNRWMIYLSMIALEEDRYTVAEGLKIPVFPPVETENFPVQFLRNESPFEAPIAVADFETGGTLEIASHGGSKLFKSNADGTFAPLTSLDGVAPGNGIYPADFDGDGDQDLFITRGGTLPNSLLRNVGSGKFEDITIEQGLLAFSDTATAAWLDYDNDGWMDLMVGNRDHPLELYRQSGAGLFEPIAWEVELRIDSGVSGIEVADVNLDGYPDFYLSIDQQADQLLFTQSGLAPEGWRFAEKSAANGITGNEQAGSAKFFDFDNDGDLDLVLGQAAKTSAEAQAGILAAGAETTSALRLYQNNGDGTLGDVTDDCGFGRVADIRNPEIVDVRCIEIADLDNDGYEDIVIGSGEMGVNRAFWNREGMDFRDVSMSSGLSYVDAPDSFVSTDLNMDGTVDLFTTSAKGEIRWQEAAGGKSSWLSLDLAGSRPGTRVAFVVRDKDWVLHPIQRVAGISPRITVGLGEAKTVESIQVFAPEKEDPVKMLEAVEPNQSIQIQIPKEPKRRAVVPITSLQGESGAPDPVTTEQ